MATYGREPPRNRNEQKSVGIDWNSIGTARLCTERNRNSIEMSGHAEEWTSAALEVHRQGLISKGIA